MDVNAIATILGAHAQLGGYQSGLRLHRALSTLLPLPFCAPSTKIAFARRCTMLHYSCSLLCLLLAFVCRCSGWGNLGHRTIALLAEKNLSPPAKIYLGKLLGNDDLSDASIWADAFKFTPEGAYTSSWHFLDAHDDPPTTCTIDLAVDCPDSRLCIITAISKAVRRVTRGAKASSHTRRSRGYKTIVCPGLTTIRR